MGNSVLIVSGYFKEGGLPPPQPHQDRLIQLEPGHGKAVMPGSMTAGMGLIG